MPTILTLLLAAALWLVDPVRQAGPMLAVDRLPLEPMPAMVGSAVRTDDRPDLPSAFVPRRRVLERVCAYAQIRPGDAPAFVRIVVAQDRRDLMAYDPIYAMRAGGWLTIGSQAEGKLLKSIHARPADPTDQTMVLLTAFVRPGTWGAHRQAILSGGPIGPGWPGPGAVVQAMVPQGSDASAIRRLVESKAQRLARVLEDGVP